MIGAAILAFVGGYLASYYRKEADAPPIYALQAAFCIALALIVLQGSLMADLAKAAGYKATLQQIASEYTCFEKNRTLGLPYAPVGALNQTLRLPT